MRKIRDTSAVPRGDWTYVDPEDGTRLKSPYYTVLMGRAKEYRRANNYPVGANFNSDFDQILCANNPDACIEFEEPSLATQGSTVLKALARWAISGFKVRSSADAEAALNVCRGCEFYAGESGLLKVVCKKCRCSKKKAYLASEHCPIGRW